MLRNLLILAAWATFALMCFVTLSPLGLRPETGAVGAERFLAYALLGALFTFAYPGHAIRVALFVLSTALVLEALQHLTPDRHGHLMDAAEKAAGGVVGCVAARLSRLWQL